MKTGNNRSSKGFGISEEDLEYIFGDNYQNFKETIIPNVLCSNCNEGSTTIVDYSIELNDLNDILLRGKCGKCGHDVARYVETGENSEYVERIENVRSRN